jgi:hypothetical protein
MRELYFGATTLSIMTQGIVTLSIATPSIMIFSIRTHSIMRPNILMFIEHHPKSNVRPT